MAQINKAQPTLSNIKGGLEYDLHDEKQVYPPYNKKPLQEFKRLRESKTR